MVNTAFLASLFHLLKFALSFWQKPLHMYNRVSNIFKQHAQMKGGIIESTNHSNNCSITFNALISLSFSNESFFP